MALNILHKLVSLAKTPFLHTSVFRSRRLHNTHNTQTHFLHFGCVDDLYIAGCLGTESSLSRGRLLLCLVLWCSEVIQSFTTWPSHFKLVGVLERSCASEVVCCGGDVSNRLARKRVELCRCWTGWSCFSSHDFVANMFIMQRRCT